MAQNIFLDHRHTVDVVSVDATVDAVTIRMRTEASRNQWRTNLCNQQQ